MVLIFIFISIYSHACAHIFIVNLIFILRLEDMKDQLRKRMFKKRKVRRITFSIANGISLELNTYALIRPTVPGMCAPISSVQGCQCRCHFF